MIFLFCFLSFLFFYIIIFRFFFVGGYVLFTQANPFFQQQKIQFCFLDNRKLSAFLKCFFFKYFFFHKKHSIQPRKSVKYEINFDVILNDSSFLWLYHHHHLWITTFSNTIIIHSTQKPNQTNHQTLVVEIDFVFSFLFLKFVC